LIYLDITSMFDGFLFLALLWLYFLFQK